MSALEVRLAPEQLAELAGMILQGLAKGPSTNRPLTVKEAAAATGIPVRTLYDRIKAGSIRTLPDIGSVRIPQAEIRRLNPDPS